MRNLKTYVIIMSFFVYILICQPSAFAQDALPHPSTYIPRWEEVLKHKKLFDDPSPLLKILGPKQILPPNLYEKLTFDVEEMKTRWSDLVGFKAPDEVNKIAAEIKPGKYTYQDMAKYPGFKKLMWPDLYDRIQPGGPPHAGRIPEFEIVPTRQYYWALPIADATEHNQGKTKLDSQGYIIDDSYEGGIPFPRVSGKFKAQQIMYNIDKRYTAWGMNFCLQGTNLGYTKALKKDFNGSYKVNHLRLSGRVFMDPKGYFDERADKREEMKGFIMSFLSPRDIAGAVQGGLYYEKDRNDQLMMYLPSLRRIRKMSATDSQDPTMGQDCIYDDHDGWMQKISPTRYPYKFEVIEEREYLVPSPSLDGSEYITSEEKGLEFRGLKFERRPMYVLKLTHLDPNYLSSS